MSTLALELAGADASAAQSEGGPGFFKRWIEMRQAKANGVVRAHLASLPDARLAGLGFTPEDILALRAGALRLPQTPAEGV